MKYLIDLFVPYGSFFETNILLTSMSSTLNYIFIFVEITFFDFFSVFKIYVLSTHSYNTISLSRHE